MKLRRCLLIDSNILPFSNVKNNSITVFLMAKHFCLPKFRVMTHAVIVIKFIRYNNCSWHSQEECYKQFSDKPICWADNSLNKFWSHWLKIQVSVFTGTFNIDKTILFGIKISPMQMHLGLDTLCIGKSQCNIVHVMVIIQFILA